MGESEDTTRELNVYLSEKHHPDRAPEQLYISINQVNWELFEKRMDEYGFNHKSAAARHMINIGLRSIVDNDPRNQSNKDRNNTQDTSGGSEGLEDFVPEGEENSLNIKEDEVVDKFEKNILTIIDGNPELKRDGLEVWK